MSLKNCIYCSEQFAPEKGEGDHIIPVQFGDFRNAKRFRGCCFRCNNDIGKSEEQLLRCGPEAVMLDEFKPALPRNRNRGSQASVGAQGALPPQHFVVHPDHEQRVIPHQSRHMTVCPTDGLSIRLRNGNNEYLKLYSSMTRNGLQRKLMEYMKLGIEAIYLQCEADNHSHYMELIKAIAPQCKIEKLPETPAGLTPVTVKTVVEVTSHYFRAIAKMAFHYYLSYSLRGLNGVEDIFSEIRHFILNGGDPEQFVRCQKIRFGATIKSWLLKTLDREGRCHFFGIEDGVSTIAAFVKMFHGDDRSTCYRVQLGRVASGWTHESHHAHAFVYDQPQALDGFAGTIHEVPLISKGVPVGP